MRRPDQTHHIPALKTPQQTRPRATRLPAQMRLALVAALASLALGILLMQPASQPAHAAPARPHLPSCNGPCINITNPLYPSDGKLIAEGPVGSHLSIEGVNWPSSTTITVWPAPDAATCAVQLAQPPDYAGSIQVNGVGIAGGTYTWPQAANQVNQTYILCAVDGLASASPTVQSNGINTFTVLSADAPTLTVSTNSIIQGQDTALTVSGQNWLPGNQALTVTICSDPNQCANSSIASQTTLSGQDGTFEITLTIKANADPGTYFVQAVSANQAALQAPPSNAPIQLTISAPTPTPTATPTPTPTPTPSTPHPGASKGGTTLLIVLLGVLSLIFLVGGIISIAIYTRGGA